MDFIKFDCLMTKISWKKIVNQKLTYLGLYLMMFALVPQILAIFSALFLQS